MNNTIVVDQSKFHARTHRMPPKHGAVVAVFSVGGVEHAVVATSYKAAENEVKRLHARPAGIRLVVLEDVQARNG
jgi:hypothetical protein